MDLYLLRHAIAEDIAEGGHGADSERRLTSEGARKMRRIAEGLKDAGLGFDLILSSPCVRARQTAEIVAAVFGLKKHWNWPLNLPPTATRASSWNHSPTPTGSAGAWCWWAMSLTLAPWSPYCSLAAPAWTSGLKKGGICKLTAEDPVYGQCATLEWLITPRLTL